MKISGQLRSCSPHRWQFLVVLAIYFFFQTSQVHGSSVSFRHHPCSQVSELLSSSSWSISVWKGLLQRLWRHLRTVGYISSASPVTLPRESHNLRTSPSPAGHRTGQKVLPSRTRTVEPLNSPGTSTSQSKGRERAVDNDPRTNQLPVEGSWLCSKLYGQSYFRTIQKSSGKFPREFW